MIFLLFPIFIKGNPNCTDLYEWQFTCEEPKLNDKQWTLMFCESNGNSWNQTCEAFENISCEGSKNFTRRQWCPNVKGYHYGRAVLFSYLFGIFGVDRFYLGYPSVGFIKLFTGGIFIIGYMVDCILITCQILGPANGNGYAALKPFPQLTGLPHRDIF